MLAFSPGRKTDAGVKKTTTSGTRGKISLERTNSANKVLDFLLIYFGCKAELNAKLKEDLSEAPFKEIKSQPALKLMH